MASHCDLCGKAVPSHTLVRLLDIYQVDGIVEICPDCEKWANNLKTRLLSDVTPQMRHAIIAKARKNNPETTTPPWWKRIVL